MIDINKLALEAYPILMQNMDGEEDWDINKQYRDCWIEGYNKALTIQFVSVMFCSYFDADLSTSSKTKCKCGREKWEHPN